MPLYEYKCLQCSNKFEILHKSMNSLEDVVCPSCMSKENKKLFSKFQATVQGGSSMSDSFGGCADGSCGIPSPAAHTCSSGSCCSN